MIRTGVIGGLDLPEKAEHSRDSRDTKYQNGNYTGIMPLRTYDALTVLRALEVARRHTKIFDI